MPFRVAIYVAGTTTVVDHLQYGSFGQILNQSDSAYAPTLSYTGRQYDAATDLYYYRARWYDARVGGFLGEDPLSFAAGDPNLSRYCGNSPTNFTDPSGMNQRPDPSLRQSSSPYFGGDTAAGMTGWSGGYEEGGVRLVPNGNCCSGLSAMEDAGMLQEYTGATGGDDATTKPAANNPKATKLTVQQIIQMLQQGQLTHAQLREN